MSLALVGTEKASSLSQNHSTPLPSPMSLLFLFESGGWNGVKQDIRRRGAVRGMANLDSPGRMVIKLTSVCVCDKIHL